VLKEDLIKYAYPLSLLIFSLPKLSKAVRHDARVRARTTKQTSETEKGVTGIDNLQSSYDEIVIKLSNAKIENPKIQLDDALATKDMLVRLAEHNLVLGEARRLFSHLKCFFHLTKLL
jgi:hypothetical protein